MDTLQKLLDVVAEAAAEKLAERFEARFEAIEGRLDTDIERVNGVHNRLWNRLQEIDASLDRNVCDINDKLTDDNDLRAQVADMVREINSIQVTTGLLREERYNLADDLAKDRDFIRRVASHVDIDDLELESAIRTELREMLEDRVTVRFEVEA